MVENGVKHDTINHTTNRKSFTLPTEPRGPAEPSQNIVYNKVYEHRARIHTHIKKHQSDRLLSFDKYLIFTW